MADRCRDLPRTGDRVGVSILVLLDREEAVSKTKKSTTGKPKVGTIPYTDNCKKCPLFKEHLQLKACEKVLEDAVKAGYLDRVVE